MCGVTYEYAIVDAKASNLVIEQGSGDADDYDDVKLTVPIHVIQKTSSFSTIAPHAISCSRAPSQNPTWSLLGMLPISGCGRQLAEPPS